MQRNHSAVLPTSDDPELIVEVEHDDASGSGDGPDAMASSAAGDAAGEASGDEAYQRRLGERLRAVRRSHGLRLQDVEQRSGGRFKAVVVGSYERGDRAVSAHKLAGLATFYDVPVAELLPDDGVASRRAGADPGVRVAVDRLRHVAADDQLAPLVRLVRHVQWLRGDHHGPELALRGEDLRTVAVALGLEPDDLHDWLAERGLLAR